MRPAEASVHDVALREARGAAHPPGVAVLSCRRSGASRVFALLREFTAGPVLAPEPFAGPLADIAGAFHAGRVEAARKALRIALAAGPLLRHSVDGESYAFNELLFEELSHAGYRCVIVLREPDADWLFSKLASRQLGLRTREDVAAWRERLAAGEASPSVDERRALALVREDLRAQRWLARIAAVPDAGRLVLRFEQLCRDGVGGLAVVDELFAFAGLGPRRAVLSDESLLQMLFGGEHHTHSLAAHAPALAAARLLIADELAALGG